MAAKKSGGCVFLVHQLPQLNNKDSSPSETRYHFFKITKCSGFEDGDIQQKIKDLQKGNPCILTMPVSDRPFCTKVDKKDLQDIKRAIREKIRDQKISGVQQLNRGWFRYDPGQDPFTIIQGIFSQYNHQAK